MALHAEDGDQQPEGYRMNPQDSIFIAGAIIVGVAVIAGFVLLVFFAVVGLAKALMRPFEKRARERAAEVERRTRPGTFTAQTIAELKAHREASERRQS